MENYFKYLKDKYMENLKRNPDQIEFWNRKINDLEIKVKEAKKDNLKCLKCEHEKNCEIIGKCPKDKGD